MENGKFAYRPGRRVRAIHSYVFEGAQWLSGSWKDNEIEGTIVEVSVGPVSIAWIAHASKGPLSEVTTIKDPSPKYLKLLSFLAHTEWELGDWCLLPSSNGSKKADSHDSTEGEHDDSDAEMVNEALLASDVHTTVDLGWADSYDYTDGEHECLKMGDDIEIATEALRIKNIHSTVDVCWQDGKIQRGLDSTSLIIVDTLGDHEFFAEQHVEEKYAETVRVGVIKSVNAKEHTASVRWLKPDSEEEEIISVYELKVNPDYGFWYRDVVVMQPDQMCSEHHWVGIITNLKDGEVEVTWADGSKYMVHPQAIYVPGTDGSNGIVGFGTTEEDMTGVAGWDEDSDEDMTGMRGWGGDQDEDMTTEASWETSEDTTEDHGIENLAKLNTRCEGEEQDAAEASHLLQTAETLCNFKPLVPNASASFQVLERVPLDHHFLDSQKQNVPMKLLRKVQ